MHKKQKFRLFLLSICTMTLFSSFDFAEHKKIGDEAFALLPYRLVEAGIFANLDSVDFALNNLFKLESHTESPAKILGVFSMKPNYVTYGTLNALSGDHVPNPHQLEVELQTRFSKTNRILSLETEESNRFNPGAKPSDLLAINPAFGMMAIRDLSHFLNYGHSLNEHLKMINIDLVRKLQDPQNIEDVFVQLEQSNCLTKYFTLHYFAIHLAQKSGKEARNNNQSEAKQWMYYALLYEAFANHFLQDGFASGHMFVNRGFTASAVVNNKALHDFYNGVPTKSYNLKGETWMALGDKKLNSADLNEGGYQYRLAEDQKLDMYKGIPDSVLDYSERKSQLLSHAVVATYTSMIEVWDAANKAKQGDDKDIIEELATHKDHLDNYIFSNSKVVYCIHIPYGSNRENMPCDMIPNDKLDDFDQTLQLPFSRGFIRSRVANSVMVILGMTNFDNLTIGGRINISMFNFNTAHLGKRGLEKGKVIHWFNPTISGSYTRNADFIFKSANDRETADMLKRIEGNDMQQYMWNIKGGLNHTTDIFLAEKRFFSIFTYLEGGVDVRDKLYIDPNIILNPDFSNLMDKYKRVSTANFTFVPTVGLQLGSLIGLHRFTVKDWIRIPLSIILPLKISVSYHITHGMKPMWAFNSEIDILF